MGEMKRLWAAVSILAALLAAALGTGWWVDGLTADYVSRLEQAQAMSERGDWERAAQVTGGVYRNWQERSFWLHALLRHSDTDQVLLLFRSVEDGPVRSRQRPAHRPAGAAGGDGGPLSGKCAVREDRPGHGIHVRAGLFA